MSDSTKNILVYECVKATTDFHGRKWTVWFSPDFLDNPLGSLNDQMGGDITISGNSGVAIFASSDVVDLIETDYR